MQECIAYLSVYELVPCRNVSRRAAATSDGDDEKERRFGAIEVWICYVHGNRAGIANLVCWEMRGEGRTTGSPKQGVKGRCK